MFEYQYVKVLFRAATESMHSTTLSGLLSVETTICVTNVSDSLIGSQQVKPSLQSLSVHQAGLVCDC